MPKERQAIETTSPAWHCHWEPKGSSAEDKQECSAVAMELLMWMKLVKFAAAAAAVEERMTEEKDADKRTVAEEGWGNCTIAAAVAAHLQCHWLRHPGH